MNNLYTIKKPQMPLSHPLNWQILIVNSVQQTTVILLKI